MIDSNALDPDLSSVGRKESGDQAQQGRLAAPAGTQQGRNLTLGNIQGNVGYRDHVSEVLAQALKRDVSLIH
jgi:hypothetical protein